MPTAYEMEELDPKFSIGIIKIGFLFLDYQQQCKQVSSMQKEPYGRYCNVESPKQVKRKKYGSLHYIDGQQLVFESFQLNPEEGGKQSSSKMTLFKSIDRVKTAKKSYSHFNNGNLYRSTQMSQMEKQKEKNNQSFIVSTAQTLKLLSQNTRPTTTNNSRIVQQLSYNKRTHQEESSVYKSSNFNSRNFQTIQTKNVEHSLLYPYQGEESPVKGLMLSVVDNNGSVKKEINLRCSPPQSSFVKKKLSAISQAKNENAMMNSLNSSQNGSRILNTSIVKPREQSVKESIADKKFKISMNNSYMSENRKTLLKKNNQIQNSVLIWDKDSKSYNFEKKQLKDIFQPKPKEDLDALTRLKMEHREQDLDLTTLTQPAPQYEDLIVHEWEERNFKIFNVFHQEANQYLNLKNFIQYSGQIAHGKKEGLGGLLDSDGNFYYGQWIEDQKCGFGMCFFSDKRIYKGFWSNDQFNGHGILKQANGDTILANFAQNDIKDGKAQILFNNDEWYCGQLKRRARQGKGTYYYKNGDVYIGEWNEGYKHGEGELKFANGRYFKGKFKKDQFHNGMYKDELGNIFKTLQHAEKNYEGKFINGRIFGYGRAEYTNKEIYVGQFKDGKRSGHGKMAYQQFNKYFHCMETAEYEGEWKFNYRHGKGTMKWADGSKFEGEWNMDKRVVGKMYMKDGSIYKGSFKNEVFHGKAEILFKDQNKYFGKFIDGKSLKFGKMQYKSGDLYMGELINYKKEGVGILVKKNGDRYEGTFNEDIASGFGMIYYSNGDIYIGDVINFKKSGRGRMYHKQEQEIYEGSYLNDDRDGNGYLIYQDGRVYCGQFSHNVEHGVGEYLLEKDVREISEVDLLKNKYNDITVKIYNGCRDLGFEYKAKEPYIIL